MTSRISSWYWELHNAEKSDTWIKCSPSIYQLLKDFAKIPLHIVLEHQADTNNYCSNHDKQSSNWLYELVLNSMTIELCDNNVPIYNNIWSSHHSGIDLTKLVLDEIFFLSWNIINSLKDLFKLVDSQGLACIQGKNIFIITKCLYTSVISLDEVVALPDETYGDILCGLTKCSNDDFKTVF